MNRFLIRIALLLTAVIAAVNADAQTRTFKGEITDEKLNCIQTPVKATGGITDKTSCVLYWAHFVQPGSKYVLYNAETKTTYQLDNQDLVQPWVAGKVEITGTLDSANKMIRVTNIKTDESAYKTGPRP